MSVQYFPPTKEGETAAHAVAEPKNIIYDGNRFVVSDGADYVAPPSDIPQEITREQALLALNAMGLYSSVMGYVASAPVPIQIAFVNQVWRRDNKNMIAGATAMGLSAAQIDAIFLAAPKIVPQ
jgi:hypothetical protein